VKRSDREKRSSLLQKKVKTTKKLSICMNLGVQTSCAKRLVYIREVCWVKIAATVTDDRQCTCLSQARQKIEMILSLLHRPRWPRQVQLHVAVAGIVLPIGLHHPLDAITNPKYKLLMFIQLTISCKKKSALAFNRDRCCHLALCL
jgi:hypothetical protein